MPHRSQRTCLEFRVQEPEKSPEHSGTHYMAEGKHSVLEKLTVWYQNPTSNTKSANGHDLATLPTPLILTIHLTDSQLKGGYTLVTLPRIVTPYRDSVDGPRARVTYQKLVTR
jgi:hypothetical protein